jgi:hypothetical protein
MIPDARLGIAILTNQESGAAFEAIADHIMDGYLGAPASDWIAAFQAIEKRGAAATASSTQTAGATRDAASKPSLPLERYAGQYRDVWYGDVTISLLRAEGASAGQAAAAGGLAIKFDRTPLLTGTLEHWQHDTFVARWTDRELRADAFVTFALNPDGTIDTVKMRAVSPDTDFSYDFQDLLFRRVR